MARRKKEKLTVQGGELLTSGDVIQLMDGGKTVKCRVLSVLAAEGGGCFAALEILEGERKGERIETRLRAGEKPDEGTSG
jgi:hypothetical protein